MSLNKVAKIYYWNRDNSNEGSDLESEWHNPFPDHNNFWFGVINGFEFPKGFLF